MGLAVLLVIPTSRLLALMNLLQVHTEALPTLAVQEVGTNEEITSSGWNDSNPYRLRF
ncbi:hypothetical protein ABR781_26950 [Bacillus cereus]